MNLDLFGNITNVSPGKALPYKKEISSKPSIIDNLDNNGIVHHANIERKAVFKTKSLIVYDTFKREMMMAFNPKAKNNLNNQNGNDSTMNGYLSQASRRYLERILAVWLTAIELKTKIRIQKKEVNTEKVFPTFVTLTLPSTQMHGDLKIKAEILNPFIKWLTQKSNNVYTMGPKKGKQKGFGVKCFFWRAEPQKNTRIHFHIIADKYVPWERIREEWNRCCDILGYVSRYAMVQKEKYKDGFKTNKSQLKKDMNNVILISQEFLKNDKIINEDVKVLMDKYKEYNFNFSERLNLGEVKKTLVEKQYKSYLKAFESGFRNPPSTEIRAIQHLESITAYVIKYITKKPQELPIEPNQRVIYDEGEKTHIIQTFENQMDPVTNEKKETIIDQRKYVPKFEERKIFGRIWGCADILRGFKITDDLIIEEDDIGRKFVVGQMKKEIVDGKEKMVEVKHEKIPITEMKFFTKTISKREVMADYNHPFTKLYTSPEMEIDSLTDSFIHKLEAAIGKEEIERVSSKVGKGFEKINGLIIPIIPERMGYQKKKTSQKLSNLIGF